mmetsp:Transcript_31280/g.71896  ORF Transcript_31280/g.71896 Transcript_31280/m.71896 type:complete len:568 (+) Transcript_31280:1151-2854(+)
MPTADEIVCQRRAYLPPLATTPAAGAEVSDDARVAMQAALLDRHFRLLREDMIGLIQEELRNITRARDKNDLEEALRSARNVVGILAIEEVVLESQPRIRVSFAWPSQHSVLKHQGKKARLKFWEEGSSQHTLEEKALIVLCIPGSTPLLGQVVCRDEMWLSEERPSIGLAFYGSAHSRDDVSNLLGRLGRQHHDAFPHGAILVQAGASTFQYIPVLNSLQAMAGVPLCDELVLGQQSEAAPSYAADIDVGAKLSKLALNPSQARALTHALSSRVALTQGPPGTGKTFVGVKLAEIIHRLTDQKILCVCYTNHALDSFLPDLLDSGITEITRVGGNSKTERLKPYNIREQEGTSVRSRAAERMRFALQDELVLISKEVKALLGRLEKTAIGPKWWQTVAAMLAREEPDIYAQLQVVSTTDSDGMRIVVFGGAALTEDYLWKRWLSGGNAGVLKDTVTVAVAEQLRQRAQAADPSGFEPHVSLFALSKVQCKAYKARIENALSKTDRDELARILDRYEVCKQRKLDVKRGAWTEILESKRVIGCTTTGAASFKEIRSSVNRRCSRRGS